MWPVLSMIKNVYIVGSEADSRYNKISLQLDGSKPKGTFGNLWIPQHCGPAYPQCCGVPSLMGRGRTGISTVLWICGRNERKLHSTNSRLRLFELPNTEKVYPLRYGSCYQTCPSSQATSSFRPKLFGLVFDQTW